MSLPMPAALLVGGASRRMGRPKADLPWQGTTLAAWQAARLSRLFPEVWIVAKEGQRLPEAPGRRLDEAAEDPAALHGLIRALEEARGKVFVLAVDLPFVTDALVSRIAQEGARCAAPAFLPESEGRLQPLAAVWDAAILPEARRRRSDGLLSLTELARAVGAEVLPADAMADLNPGGTAFRNLNTPADLTAAATA
jgi:molybdopterin-guanine dinucleotide biosynthesis protein A